jgi:hypothetical protein
MLSSFDDYRVHQSAAPISESPNQPNLYDRDWFNGYDKDGEFYFAIGSGIYPGRGIHDGAFSLVIDGTQYAFFTSAYYEGPRQLKSNIGPFELETLVPMRSSRLVIKSNDTGIECDLIFSAKSCCIEESRQTLKHEDHLLMDVTRFAQLGQWQGWIRYKGKTLEISPARVLGTKDRSWGVRPLGNPKPQPESSQNSAPPLKSQSPFFFLWAPIHWETHGSHYCLFEDTTGKPLFSDGAIVPFYSSVDDIPTVVDENEIRFDTLSHELTFTPGSRRVKKAVLTMASSDREASVIELEPLLTFNMAGLGYNHPEWSQGADKGPSAIGYEEWRPGDMSGTDPLNQHVQTVMRAVCDGQIGIGVLEQGIFGPSAKYGFKDYLDAA